MPNSTVIDFTAMSIGELLAEHKGLWDELEEAQLRIKQITHDLEAVMDELLRRSRTEEPQQN